MKILGFIWLLVGLFACPVAMAANAEKIPPSHSRSIDDMAAFLNGKSLSKEDKLWSIQAWMSENMTYDFEKRDKYEQERKRRNRARIEGSSDSQRLSMEVIAKAAFRSKSGVCEDYVKLFIVLAGKVGVEMFYVSGTTDSGGSHAWCACLLDSVPYLFDPTWSSGYCDDNYSVYKKCLTTKYFMATPDSFAHSHIPLDPMLQFSDYPLSYDLVPQNRYFNWRDSLALYQQQDTLAQMQSVYRRALKNGKRNDVLEGDIYLLKQNISVAKYNSDLRLYNRLVDQVEKTDRQMVELHNMLVDQKYVSHNAEGNLRKTLGQMQKVLDDVDAQIPDMGTLSKELVSSYTGLRRTIAYERKRLSKCSSLLDKRKSDASRQVKR
ncbi:MAG: hypothetical protein IK005_03040 [Paludibacteraceae bacterium]|nr:hypothetical protein [Paludibacteraceae bacterium]